MTNQYVHIYIGILLMALMIHAVFLLIQINRSKPKRKIPFDSAWDEEGGRATWDKETNRPKTIKLIKPVRYHQYDDTSAIAVLTREGRFYVRHRYDGITDDSPLMPRDEAIELFELTHEALRRYHQP